MGTHRDSSTEMLSNWPYGHPDTTQTRVFDSHCVIFGHDVRAEAILKTNSPIRGRRTRMKSLVEPHTSSFDKLVPFTI